ncbi:hypothetical protein KSP39_PZI014114 [Platanthera zijinensis]|uniref:Retroviral polymerase SH3-like domain-containing protein n=1 Tax=Platanthera zijinensis TaxID=2320716 RepID=A0AAP0BC86_9ASPA
MTPAAAYQQVQALGAEILQNRPFSADLAQQHKHFQELLVFCYLLRLPESFDLIRQQILGEAESPTLDATAARVAAVTSLLQRPLLSSPPPQDSYAQYTQRGSNSGRSHSGARGPSRFLCSHCGRTVIPLTAVGRNILICAHLVILRPPRTPPLGRLLRWQRPQAILNVFSLLETHDRLPPVLVADGSPSRFVGQAWFKSPIAALGGHSLCPEVSLQLLSVTTLCNAIFSALLYSLLLLVAFKTREPNGRLLLGLRAAASTSSTTFPLCPLSLPPLLICFNGIFALDNLLLAFFDSFCPTYRQPVLRSTVMPANLANITAPPSAAKHARSSLARLISSILMVRLPSPFSTPARNLFPSLFESLLYSLVHAPSATRDKLSPRATKCVFWATRSLRKATVALTPVLRKQFVSADVTFFENAAYFSSPPLLPPIPDSSPSLSVPSPPIHVSPPSSSSPPPSVPLPSLPPCLRSRLSLVPGPFSATDAPVPEAPDDLDSPLLFAKGCGHALNTRLRQLCPMIGLLLPSRRILLLAISAIYLLARTCTRTALVIPIGKSAMDEEIALLLIVAGTWTRVSPPVGTDVRSVGSAVLSGSLSQRLYALDLLRDCRIDLCQIGTVIPWLLEKTNGNDDSPLISDKHKVLEVGGLKLIDLTVTRPDIAYAVGKHTGKGLTLSEDGHLRVEAYSDSSYSADDKDDRKSTSGFCTFVGVIFVSFTESLLIAEAPLYSIHCADCDLVPKNYFMLVLEVVPEVLLCTVFIHNTLRFQCRSQALLMMNTAHLGACAAASISIFLGVSHDRGLTLHILGRTLLLLYHEPARDVLELTHQFTGKALASLAYSALFPLSTNEYNWFKALGLRPRKSCFGGEWQKDAIPTKCWLSRHGLADSSSCPWGCATLENRDHLLTRCSNLNAVGTALWRGGFAYLQSLPGQHSLPWLTTPAR